MVDAVVAARRRAAAVIGRLMFGVVHSFSCHAVERRSLVAAKRTHAEMRVQGERGGVVSLGRAWLWWHADKATWLNLGRAMMWQKQSRWYLQVLGDLGLGSLAGLDGVKKDRAFFVNDEEDIVPPL